MPARFSLNSWHFSLDEKFIKNPDREKKNIYSVPHPINIYLSVKHYLCRLQRGTGQWQGMRGHAPWQDQFSSWSIKAGSFFSQSKDKKK